MHTDHGLSAISADPAYQEILSQAQIAAKTDATILIRGENGSGKEVLAKFIHENSARNKREMVVVNCAAIPEQLIESELFGYEDGSFTGAKKGGKPGKFQLADRGTIFLDEIGDMPFSMQSKLLRVLQEGELEKIGRQVKVPVNIRVIAATNQPLEQLIALQKFRQDLFYRLNVISFTIPPLRERKEDILMLSNRFLQMFNGKYGRNVTLSPEIFQLFLNYGWPGNVRELRNCIESLVIICAGNTAHRADLPQCLKQMRGTPLPEEDKDSLPAFGSDESLLGDLQEKLKNYEKHLIQTALSCCNGDKALAAEKLHISKRSLYRKLSDLHLEQNLSATANRRAIWI